MKMYAKMNTALLAAFLASGVLATSSANAALVFTDHPQGATATTFYNSLTNVIAGNDPPGDNRFSLDAGDTDGQSITVVSATTLDSIYLGYNDQQSTGTFNLHIDLGNNGSNDHTFLITLSTLSDLQAGGGNGGPYHFMQFDVSSENIALAAGVHSFKVQGVTDNGEGAFLFAPNFSSQSTAYEGGQMLSSSGRDLVFAVTEVPEPCSLALLGLGGLCLLRRRRREA